MTEMHRRRKDPEDVRRRLLEAAADLIVARGPAGMTLEAVARAAGVSKGGLLHHFPDKPALFHGLFERVIRGFDAEIDRAMAADPGLRGRFTRAYLAVVVELQETPRQQQDWAALTVALLSEPGMRSRWGDWVAARARAHAATDSFADAMLVRCAADGLWLSELTAGHRLPEADRARLVARLRAFASP